MSDNIIRDKLLQELATLRDAVIAAKGDEQCRHVTAVLKLVDGLSLQSWTKLAPSLELNSLLALPLKGDLYPLVLHLLRTIENLSAQADCDPATGLPERKGFTWALELEVERAIRNQNSLSLALMEIRLPAESQSLSGSDLEQTMTQAAAIITAGRRKYDFMARVGGNRFAMIFPGIGLQRSRSVLERQQADIRVMDAQAREPLTCLVGIANIKGRIPFTGTEFLELAENALSQAKDTGGDAIVTAPIPDIAVALKSTLVLSQEKQFLFTGS